MIESEGLTKRFDDFLAVKEVSLKVEAGELLALLGPNGAGKTTTVRMLTSTLVPSEGWAKIAGHSVVDAPTEVRASVGVLTEQHGLYLRMDGIEYLDFFGELYGIPESARRKRAYDLAERFGLAEVLDKRLGHYSKGMKQKLALVRAMLHDPPVLLLDEPTSAMDPHSARQVRNAIADLRSDGRTIMVCTHNLPEAEELSDRIAIIRHGEIIAKGTVAELKTKLLGPPLLELRLSDAPNGVVENLADLVEVESSGPDWVRYRTDNPKMKNPLILRTLAGDGVDVITLSEVKQSLEDVYLSVVGEGDETQVEEEA